MSPQAAERSLHVYEGETGEAHGDADQFVPGERFLKEKNAHRYQRELKESAHHKVSGAHLPSGAEGAEIVGAFSVCEVPVFLYVEEGVELSYEISVLLTVQNTAFPSEMFFMK